MRLDRLISDISDASRIDAELSRAADRAGGRGADPGNAGGAGRRDARARTTRGMRGRRAAERRLRGAGGGGPAGPGAAQPDRQRAVASARRDGRIWLRAREAGDDGGDQRRGRGPRHPRGQAGAHLRPLLLRAAERASGSASIPASACRSAGRSSRRCAGASPPRTGATPRATVIGARFVVRLPRAA